MPITAILRRAVLPGLAALLLSAPGFAQDDGAAASSIIEGVTVDAPAPQSALASWSVVCSGEGDARECGVMQDLALGDGATIQRLLTVMVQPDGAGGETLVLVLPHGVLFLAGVEIGIDRVQMASAAVQTSDPAGAYGGTPLTPELLAAMRSGAQMQVAFASIEGKSFAVPVSLDGFSAAYDRAKQGLADPE